MLRKASARFVTVTAGNGSAYQTLTRSLSTHTRADKHLNRDTVPVFPQESGFVRDSPYDAVQIPDVRIDQYVWNSVREWETLVATVCGVTGRAYTYAELRDRSAAFAVRLQVDFNLNANAVVACCLPNVPEFPIVTLGAIEAGMIVTTVNPIYTAEEISRQLISSNASLIVTVVDRYDTVREACALAKKPIKIVCIQTDGGQTIPAGTINFHELTNPKAIDFGLLKSVAVKPDDVALLPYSSGTTGLAKGVMLTHNNITTNSEMLQVATNGTTIVERASVDYQESLPCVLPFFHIYGLTVTMLSKLSLGCKLITLPGFRPETFLNALVEHKGSVLHLVPPIIIFLGHHDKVQQKHTEHIRSVMSGAAPLGACDAERFHTRAPNTDFLQGYGLTETSPVCLMGRKGCKNFGTVGNPTPNSQAKIVALNDASNTGMGPNQTGELFVRGPQVMKGYLNNPIATDEMIVENGWLRTGDIAHYDEQGDFYITDRLKELIKVKGFQVPPAELEEILRTHPNVIDAAVIGQPHAIYGEVPRAFIVAKNNAEITEKELQDFVAAKVASYKKLEGGVTFIESIPKNASGKILRRELKNEYCN